MGCVAMVTTMMMRAIVVCAAVLAICLATSSLAKGPASGEIVRVGKGIYKLRMTNELIATADRQAMKRAREYCARMNQTMEVKNKTFDMGYGYTLTWSCVPSQHPSIDY